MKKPFYYALGAVTYIVLIVLIINATKYFPQKETIIIPITMLSLFVLSAAVMGFLFLSEPLRLFLEGQKKEAVSFFAKIVGIFACFVIIFAILILLKNTSAKNLKDATYMVEGQKVTLNDGVTKYFGNEVTHDFDGDSRPDTVFLLTQNPGGSGTFYYVVVALNTKDGYIGSNAVFLGDRIAPQTTEINKNNEIVVNYADRKLTDSFATPPSIGKSLYLIFNTQTNQLEKI